MQPEDFADTGWCMLDGEAGSDRWVSTARAEVDALLAASGARDWRAGGTWYPGVNALPNDQRGGLSGGVVLPPELVAHVARISGTDVQAWDRGQVSVCRPGYPKIDPTESVAATRYRRNRDAAHVDGLLPVGEKRRRHVRERHAFILGIPLTDIAEGNAPLVVWQGSHGVMRDAFSEVLRKVDPVHWAEIDLTDAYHAARRRVFETAKRCLVTAKAGRPYLVHRHALHGVSPWTANDDEPVRIVIYFRPEVAGGIVSPDWLTAP